MMIMILLVDPVGVSPGGEVAVFGLQRRGWVVDGGDAPLSSQ